MMPCRATTSTAVILGLVPGTQPSACSDANGVLNWHSTIVGGLANGALGPWDKPEDDIFYWVSAVKRSEPHGRRVQTEHNL
jgi:hypothetical protein